MAFLKKAMEDLADAQAAVAASRHNACARNAYYAAYFAAYYAAVAALWHAGIRPASGAEGTLSHRMVQAEWAGRLIYRRKLYPLELRSALRELMQLRLRADYTPEPVSARRARAAVALCASVVEHVRGRLSPTGNISTQE